MPDFELTHIALLPKAVLVGAYVTLAAIVFLRLLKNEIVIRGLMAAKEGGAVSPERAQLLVVSFGSMFSYAVMALDAGTLPPPPDELIAVFAASNLFYVSGKSARRYLPGVMGDRGRPKS